MCHCVTVTWGRDDANDSCVLHRSTMGNEHHTAALCAASPTARHRSCSGMYECTVGKGRTPAPCVESVSHGPTMSNNTWRWDMWKYPLLQCWKVRCVVKSFPKTYEGEICWYILSYNICRWDILIYWVISSPIIYIYIMKLRCVDMSVSTTYEVEVCWYVLFYNIWRWGVLICLPTTH